MKLELSFPFTEPELKDALVAADKGNALPLRTLCQKEAQCFEEAIRQHPDYRDGLVRIERRAVEGYIYQKVRGHINADPRNNPLSKEK